MFKLQGRVEAEDLKGDKRKIKTFLLIVQEHMIICPPSHVVPKNIMNLCLSHRNVLKTVARQLPKECLKVFKCHAPRSFLAGCDHPDSGQPLSLGTALPDCSSSSSNSLSSRLGGLQKKRLPLNGCFWEAGLPSLKQSCSGPIRMCPMPAS